MSKKDGKMNKGYKEIHRDINKHYSGRTSEKRKNKKWLLDKLQAMLIRSGSDIDREWGTSEIGEEMKEDNKEAVGRIKQLLQQKPKIDCIEETSWEEAKRTISNLRDQISNLKKQKPKIDKAYVDEKARHLMECIPMNDMQGLEGWKGFITQIIRDVRGE